MGVKFFLEKILKANKKKTVFTNKNNNFNYNYFINCSGLESNKISTYLILERNIKSFHFEAHIGKLKIIVI